MDASYEENIFLMFVNLSLSLLLCMKAQAQKFLDEKHPDSAKIVQKSAELDAACQRLQTLSSTRLARLKVRTHSASAKVCPHYPDS